MKSLSLNMKKAGIDADSVISRLGGDVELYMTICLKFINDPTFSNILLAVAENNLSEAGIHIHTLKGVSANLGFIRLKALCDTLLEELKNKSYFDFNIDLCRLKKDYHSLISYLKTVHTSNCK